MHKYHKIQTVYKRDPGDKVGPVIDGQFSLPEFEYLQYNKWIFTEKVDGTNIRIKINENSEGSLSGKTDKAEIPYPLRDYLHDTFTKLAVNGVLEKTLKNQPACLYGEGYGANVHKGSGKYSQDQSFVLFDVRIGDWWLKREDVEDIAEKLDLMVVPIIGFGTLSELVEIVKTGFNSVWGDFQAEGIVARPEVELTARNGNRIITKLKYKDFRR